MCISGGDALDLSQMLFCEEQIEAHDAAPAHGQEAPYARSRSLTSHGRTRARVPAGLTSDDGGACEIARTSKYECAWRTRATCSEGPTPGSQAGPLAEGTGT